MKIFLSTAQYERYTKCLKTLRRVGDKSHILIEKKKKGCIQVKMYKLVWEENFEKDGMLNDKKWD